MEDDAAYHVVWLQHPNGSFRKLLTIDFNDIQGLFNLWMKENSFKTDYSPDNLAVRCVRDCAIHKEVFIENATVLENLYNKLEHGKTKEHPFVPVFAMRNQPIVVNEPILFKCMASDYVDHNHVVEKFVDILKNMKKQTRYFNTTLQDANRDPPTYLSPYIVMAQRSGTGKTRMIFEVGRQALPVFYVCLSGPFQSSLKICTFLDGLSKKDSFIDVLALFASIGDFFLEKYRKELSLLYGRDTKIQSISSDDRAKITLALSKYFIPTSERDPEGHIAEAFEDILLKVEGWNHDPLLLKWVEDYLKIGVRCDPIIDFFKSLKELKELGFGPVVIAIDEARSLLNHPSNSSFHQLRRGANNLFEYISVVLADTSSKISNFAPKKESDSPSARESPQILFPVFHTLCTTDVLAASFLNEVLNILLNWESLNHQSALAPSLLSFLERRDSDPLAIGFHNLGLPLWTFAEENIRKNLLNPIDVNIVIGNLVDFASLKLKGMSEIIEMGGSDEKKKLIVIAALSCKAFFLIRPQSTLPETLVASHMAHLDFVETDRSKMFVSYPSDPILSAGAGKILIDGLEVFKILRNISLETSIDVGDLGEFLTQLLLCSAMDFVVRLDQNPFRSVSLMIFLRSLFGDYSEMIFQDSSQKEDFWTGTRVSFNHFANINCEISRDIFTFMFSRCAGILAKKGQSGFDMVIPTVLASGNFSAIFIQVKNKETSIAKDCAIIHNKLISSVPNFLEKKSIVFLTINLQHGRDPTSGSIYTDQRLHPPMYVFEGFSKSLYPNIWGNNRYDVYREIKNFLQDANSTVDDRIEIEVSKEYFKSLYKFERRIFYDGILKDHHHPTKSALPLQSTSSTKICYASVLKGASHK